MSWEQQKVSALQFRPDYSYRTTIDFVPIPSQVPGDNAAQTPAWQPVIANLPQTEAELYYPHSDTAWYRTGDMREVQIYQAPLFIQVPRRGIDRVGYAVAAHTCSALEFLPGQEADGVAVASIPVAPRPGFGYPLGRRVVEPAFSESSFGALASPRFLNK